ncbi:OmpA family protein [Ferruginibacter lapsinanis]|uniref:OmpA family protein n=1 Tax=Ferruginibacter lapsinanis TaxID=563172 RepID=UPI001E5BA0D1|nr:OmpA family protein [Ferruginibacter lapsinanis]UEG48499.1 OmpA family protein [Ferruginibacter lapsinanis]
MKRYFAIYIRFYFIVSCLLLIANFTNAQWYDPEKVNKKAGDIYAQAYQNGVDEKYVEAVNNIKKAIAIDPKFVDAYLTLAGIYANQKKYDSSVITFEKALELDSVYSHTYLLPYSISLAGTGQFSKALVAINKFLTIPVLNERSIKAGQYRKSVYEFAIDYEKKHSAKDYVFAPKNLGDSINSQYSEYYPSLTIDGSKMIFTRRVQDDEDFFETDLTNKKWINASPLHGKVNTTFNEGAQNISQDGEWIVFAGCNYPNGNGSCDIYISYKTNSGWSEAENLGQGVNTEYWESAPSISPDKRDIYFSSSRPDGYGGKDIWVTHRLSNGRWSEAENLGNTINTNGDEGCSFIYADNQTLFFNSNGHPGYGQSDLFLSKKINDSTWSTPQNLGYPVNTIDEEGSLIVAADGKTAYYASDGVDSRGGLDLYSFQLRKDIQPPKTLWVRGKVFDANTKQGLPSTIELTDIHTRNVISKVLTNEVGDYLATLPVGKDYAFNVNRKGYLFYSENYNIDINSIDTVYTADIPLQPLEAGAAVVLKNIFFDSKQTALKPESIIELNKVIQLMNDNPKLTILITGHTDNVGKPADNLLLSNNRAAAVVNYLLASRQISRARLQSKGLGATKPIADNRTETGRSLNRRTELFVISN